MSTLTTHDRFLVIVNADGQLLHHVAADGPRWTPQITAARWFFDPTLAHKMATEVGGVVRSTLEVAKGVA